MRSSFCMLVIAVRGDHDDLVIFKAQRGVEQEWCRKQHDRYAQLFKYLEYVVRTGGCNVWRVSPAEKIKNEQERSHAAWKLFRVALHKKMQRTAIKALPNTNTFHSAEQETFAHRNYD